VVLDAARTSPSRPEFEHVKDVQREEHGGRDSVVIVMNRATILRKAVTTSLAVALTACGSPSGESVDGGPDRDGAVATPVNGCTAADFAANDHTADSDPRAIQGPTGAAPSQYTPHCMRIRAGQTVTITTDVTDHPIDLSVVPGDPQPFPELDGIVFSDAGAAVGETVTLPLAGGIIAFTCEAHPTLMFGAIQSVP
jgi:hypothetical protein